MQLLVDDGVWVNVAQGGRIHWQFNVAVWGQGTSGVSNQLGDGVLTFRDISWPAWIDIALLSNLRHGLYLSISPRESGILPTHFLSPKSPLTALK